MKKRKLKNNDLLLKRIIIMIRIVIITKITKITKITIMTIMQKIKLMIIGMQILMTMIGI